MAKGRVLIIAGSDSGGGAGIQADIKTVTMLGGYAMTAITALTAQDTERVHAIHAVPASFVARQIEVVLDDIGADCIKTGMLPNAEVIDAVADVLERKAKGVPIVIDPVVFAKSGDMLIDREGLAALKRSLLLRAALLTPNLVEARLLSSLEVKDADEMSHCARTLLTLGPSAVLLKGGHLPGDRIRDLLVAEAWSEAYDHPRVDTRHTHGTGCTLASAIATGIAQGLSLKEATRRGISFVVEAIRRAPGLGRGHGPLGHGFALQGSLATDRPAAD